MLQALWKLLLPCCGRGLAEAIEQELLVVRWNVSFLAKVSRNSVPTLRKIMSAPQRVLELHLLHQYIHPPQFLLLQQFHR